MRILQCIFTTIDILSDPLYSFTKRTAYTLKSYICSNCIFIVIT